MSFRTSIEEQFIDQFSDYLRFFSQQSSGSYRFLCPYCQSGIKNKKGKPFSPSDGKGFLYNKLGAWFFKCHRSSCGHGTTFEKFLAEWCPAIHLEYVRRREDLGLTGYQTNCPSLKTISSKHKQQNQNSGAITPETSAMSPKQTQLDQPTSPVLSVGPKVTICDPMRTPQQQAGKQSRLNHLMKQRAQQRRHRYGC